MVPSPPFPYAGEIASLTAALIWSGSICTFSHFGRGIPVLKLNIFKNSVALLCLTVTILIMKTSLPRESIVVGALALSGLIGLGIGDSLLFAALPRLGPQLTSATQCLSPPFAALIALAALGEPLSLVQSLGMIVTLVGVGGSVVIRNRDHAKSHQIVGGPSTEVMVGFALAAASALANAVGIVLARKAMQSTSIAAGTMLRIAPTIVMLFAAQAVVGLFRRRKSPLASPNPIVVPARPAWLWLGLASFFGTFVGVMLLSAGTKYAKAGVTASLTITYPVWIIPVAAIFLKEKTPRGALLFTLVAISGVLALVLG